MRCGVDTGGTYTDVVTDDGRVRKVPSTPDDPAAAVRDGVAAVSGVGGRQPAHLAHGTTVATNALLERRGATVALVTNDGFADVVEIARQVRPSLYDPFEDRPEPLVPRQRRVGVSGPRDSGALARLGADIASVAVCLLHSDVDDSAERAVVAELARLRPALDVCASADVSPEAREYERIVTTVLNAYLRPACRSYLRGLSRLADEVLVLTSAGGLLPADVAAEIPVALLLSGPAGGVAAAAAAAALAGYPDAVTLDMGGTSTDVCLVVGGRPAPAAERTVAGFPVRRPSLDVHTIGAGGGSVAFVDAGGALRVGPRSAGARPGPACYGLGGAAPTVTDADAVLGRIDASEPLPGLGRLDVGAARTALRALGGTATDLAAGVVRVVDAAMEEAVRVVTVARGVDPRDLALVAFGGAGPLHACAVADALDMRAVVVPARAGVLSAVGALCSPERRDVVRSRACPDDLDALDVDVAAAADAARRAIGRGAGDDVIVETALDCRYVGQSHELQVPSVDAFHDAHQQRNGYARRGAPVEVVAVRALATRGPRMPFDALPPPEPARRGTVVGPAVVTEPDCTVWVPDGWRGEVGGGGAWILRRSRS